MLKKNSKQCSYVVPSPVPHEVEVRTLLSPLCMPKVVTIGNNDSQAILKNTHVCTLGPIQKSTNIKITCLVGLWAKWSSFHTGKRKQSEKTANESHSCQHNSKQNSHKLYNDHIYKTWQKLDTLTGMIGDADCSLLCVLTLYWAIA